VLIGFGSKHHDRDDSTTAATITGTLSAIPTAVITESSENTMSSSMIWPMTDANDGATPRRTVAFHPFEPLVDLNGRLAEKEESAAEQNEIAAGNLLRKHGEDRRRQSDDPRNRHQQRDAHQHRGEQARSTRA
jgi:hypothetical protein